MDLESFGVIGIIIFVFVVIIVEILLVWIVASTIASFLGLSGIYWWAFAIIIFLLINAIFNFLMRGD